MTTIIINGIDLELDLLDADVLDKYENLNQEIVQKIQEPTQYNGISTAEGMRKQCRYVDEFFDKLFGLGTAEKVFGGGNNLGVRLDAFAQVAEASNGIQNQLTSIVGKYDISRIQNRAQRRQQAKHGNGKNKGNRPGRN